MYASYIPMVMQFLLMAMVSRTVAIYGSHWGRLDKKAVDNDTVATPLNVEASQHWDGNDGPWSIVNTEYAGHSLTVYQVIFHPTNRHTSTECTSPDIYRRLQYLGCQCRSWLSKWHCCWL